MLNAGRKLSCDGNQQWFAQYANIFLQVFLILFVLLNFAHPIALTFFR